MRRAKKGRPPITRIRTEMDDVETERRCGVCRMPGHSRKDCINIRHQQQSSLYFIFIVFGMFLIL